MYRIKKLFGAYNICVKLRCHNSVKSNFFDRYSVNLIYDSTMIFLNCKNDSDDT